MQGVCAEKRWEPGKCAHLQHAPFARYRCFGERHSRNWHRLERSARKIPESNTILVTVQREATLEQETKTLGDRASERTVTLFAPFLAPFGEGLSFSGGYATDGGKPSVHSPQEGGPTLMTTAILALFLHTFGGSWMCTTHAPKTTLSPAQTYRSEWKISAAPGGIWSIVRWGALGKHGGIAYVRYLTHQKLWVYDDYHYDGTFYRDFSSGPSTAGDWRWFGTNDQVHVDSRQGPVTWRLISPVLFRQTYRETRNGKVIDQGYADCMRS